MSQTLMAQEDLLLNTRNGATFDTLGTGDLKFKEISGSISRFAWTDLVIDDFLNTTIY